MTKKRIEIIFIGVTAIVVIVGVIVLAVTSSTEKEQQLNKTPTASATATVSGSGVVFKKEPEKPAKPLLTDAEKARYSKLESALKLRWSRETQRLVIACKEISLTPEQIEHIQKLLRERNQNLLDLYSRFPESNKEFEKARSRLFRLFRESCTKLLDRRLYQQLAGRVPDIFEARKPSGPIRPDRR